ncbi:prosaposin-like [Achroia grisella]|uniref:prosaposin-like n=1 Tax=Achroia grisella TaxID=688607 RepID=UPI0027D2EAF6|nr:prosaposin-like [Achroia grisella]
MDAPKYLQHECDKLMFKFADHLTDMLVNKMDSTQVCHSLNHCNVSTAVIENFERFEAASVNCLICKLLMRAAKKIIDTENQKHAILNFLRNTCKRLPVAYFDKCNNIVETYGNLVIEVIEDWTEKNFCKKSGFCSNF